MRKKEKAGKDSFRAAGIGGISLVALSILFIIFGLPTVILALAILYFDSLFMPIMFVMLSVIGAGQVPPSFTGQSLHLGPVFLV